MNDREEQERQEREEDEARRAAYEQWFVSGDAGMSDLDLRAAAQWAQRLDDETAERQIDDALTSRGSE
jgi:hypothetical protein